MKRETLSVLVLEDNALQRSLIKVALARQNMTPLICNDPNTLIQHLLEYAPDALLVDTYLPGQNGLELVAQISPELLRRTKIFFLSALGYPEIVQKAALLGASGFLVKPLDTDLLISRIRQSLA